ncbi:MAG: peptide/nickel transport system permease protein [bacterium]|nr:peptide/nickel transport system permease protein [bacterium]
MEVFSFLPSLRSYVLTRFILMIPMILILLTFVFIILRVLPGDPVSAILGPKASPEQKAEIREKLGLDKPIIFQYFSYLGGLLKGDFGRSMLTRRPVLDEILERFPATLELTIFSLLIAFILGLFLGVESSRRLGSSFDEAFRFYAVVVYALPVFWLGMMFQLLFGVKLGFFPVSGRISPLMEPEHITGLYLLDSLLTMNLASFLNSLKHLFLPSLTLGIVLSGVFLRLVRGNMVEVLRLDFIRAARARGISERRVLYRHALKNALIPVITMLGLEFALLLGGAVLTETTFSWPGVGTFLIMRIRYRDFAAVQGVIVFYALLVALVSVIVDMICAFIDPRVRY